MFTFGKNTQVADDTIEKDTKCKKAGISIYNIYFLKWQN